MSLDSPRTPASRLRVVLIAGAGQEGQAHTAALLDVLPELRCPILICLRDADLAPLRTRLDGVAVRWAEDGVALDAARVWLAPPGCQTYVRDGRFVVASEEQGLHAGGPTLGKVYHSLRADFGSRVFAVVVDTERSDTPQLRLMAQRGARVVSPVDCGEGAVAARWSSAEIVRHLEAEAGLPDEVVVA